MPSEEMYDVTLNKSSQPTPGVRLGVEPLSSALGGCTLRWALTAGESFQTGVEPVSVLTIDTNPPSASRCSGTNPSNAECGMGNPGWCYGGDDPAVAIRSASLAQPRQKRGYSLEQRGKARLLEMSVAR